MDTWYEWVESPNAEGLKKRLETLNKDNAWIAAHIAFDAGFMEGIEEAGKRLARLIKEGK